ncbi:MAG: hypothetical protein ACRDZX_05050 [Acidimicrobiales bacterium]
MFLTRAAVGLTGVACLAGAVVSPAPTSSAAWASTSPGHRSAALHHSAPLRHSAAAQQYLADSAPLDRASTRFEARALSWVSNPTITNDQVEKVIGPLVSAVVKFRNELEHQKWPSKSRHDVALLTKAFGKLLADLQALSHEDLSKAATWEPPLLRDDQVVTAGSNKVRHDLGLPPLAA